MSPTQEAAMKMALEALEHDNPAGRAATITALKAALAQPQEPVRLQCVTCGTVYADGVPPQVPVQEPVAKCIDDICSEHLGRVEAFDHLPRGTLLYTAPFQRMPLSEDEIFAIENDIPDAVISDKAWTIWLSRAVEAAHGIK